MVERIVDPGYSLKGNTFKAEINIITSNPANFITTEKSKEREIKGTCPRKNHQQIGDFILANMTM